MIDATRGLSAAEAIQRLLRITSDFYEYCVAYRDDTDTTEFQEYFGELDQTWTDLLSRPGTSMTDRIRALNVLRDGQELATVALTLPDGFSRALQTGLSHEENPQPER